MARVAIDLESDIQPVSDFRTNTAAILKQVQASGRPVVVTQHGRSAAVLMDVRSYLSMVEELEVLKDVVEARQQLAAGRTHTHAEAQAEIRRRIERRSR